MRTSACFNQLLYGHNDTSRQSIILFAATKLSHGTKNRVLTFRGILDAAMAPVYAVPTVHVEDLSRDLWSWASVRMIDGEETLTR